MLACFLKLGGNEAQHAWYSRLWHFADVHFIDHANGGWFPEIDAQGQPATTQFLGKPDIYHSIQAALFPMTSGISKPGEGLRGSLGK